MGRKNKNNVIPRPVVPIPKKFNIPNQPARTLAEGVDANTLYPKVSFHWFDSRAECVSDWSGEESKQLFDCLNRFCSQPWQMVLKSGGSLGGKAGLGFTNIDKGSLKRALPRAVSPDVTISELRVCQTKRVFGVRNESTFYLVWLDRTHSVVKSS